MIMGLLAAAGAVFALAVVAHLAVRVVAHIEHLLYIHYLT